jgi:uncharacterized membrane protein
MAPDETPRRSRGLRGLSEQQLAELIGHLLAGGVAVAALVVLAGGVVDLVSAPRALADYSRYRPLPPELRHVSAIAAAAARGNGLGLIQLGVVLLIATPVARVALSAVAFLRQRDRLYVAATLTVLAFLLFGLFGHVL